MSSPSVKLGQIVWAEVADAKLDPIEARDWKIYCSGYKNRIDELIGDSDFSTKLYTYDLDNYGWQQNNHGDLTIEW